MSGRCNLADCFVALYDAHVFYYGEFGEVPEWLIGPVSKTGVPYWVPRVRIPPSPLSVTESRVS